jgi:hypothetical protein
MALSPAKMMLFLISTNMVVAFFAVIWPYFISRAGLFVFHADLTRLISPTHESGPH